MSLVLIFERTYQITVVDGIASMYNSQIDVLNIYFSFIYMNFISIKKKIV